MYREVKIGEILAATWDFIDGPVPIQSLGIIIQMHDWETIPRPMSLTLHLSAFKTLCPNFFSKCHHGLSFPLKKAAIIASSLMGPTSPNLVVSLYFLKEKVLPLLI